MNSLLATPAFAIYATATTIIALHGVLLALWTGTVRAIHKAFLNPEDVQLNKGRLVDEDVAQVARVKRAHQNTLENAVPFIAIGFFYALTEPDPTWARVLMLGFVGTRIVHTLVYLRGVQPWRTLSFAVGVLCIGVMAVQVLRAIM